MRDRVKRRRWGDDAAWRAHVPSGQRWQSTNHLMGRGYWVWLIPLGSGGISIGIVADDQLHPFHRINRFDRAMEWLHEYEPQCAENMEEQRTTSRTSSRCATTRTAVRACIPPIAGLLTGEAGVFTDPFYSPGSDFIAIGNECITDLIRATTRRGCRGAIEQLNANYLRLFDAFIRLYEASTR